MIRAIWNAMPALTMLLVAGCADRPVEHTVRKVPAENTASSSEHGSPTGIAMTKEQFTKELSAHLDKIDAEIRELKAKATSLKDEARTNLGKAMANLDAKQKAARAKLDEVSAASAEAWEHLKQGSQAAWEELEQAVKEAAGEF